MDATTLLGVLGFVLSIINLGWKLAEWSLNFLFAKIWRKRDTESRIKSGYVEVQPSMEYIAGLYWYHQVLAPGLTGAPKWPWAAAYKGVLFEKHSSETDKQDTGLGTDQQQQQPCGQQEQDGHASLDPEKQLSAIAELAKHRSALDAYWDEVVRLHEIGELPKQFFKKGGGWLKRADNYRRFSEPLFIANFYRAGFDAEDTEASCLQATPYLHQVDKQYVKRPKRYQYLEQMWKQQQGEPTPSTHWAVAFEDMINERLALDKSRGWNALHARSNFDLSNVDPWTRTPTIVNCY